MRKPSKHISILILNFVTVDKLRVAVVIIAGAIVVIAGAVVVIAGAAVVVVTKMFRIPELFHKNLFRNVF